MLNNLKIKIKFISKVQSCVLEISIKMHGTSKSSHGEWIPCGGLSTNGVISTDSVYRQNSFFEFSKKIR